LVQLFGWIPRLLIPSGWMQDSLHEDHVPFQT
jgi:hypothetical protein